MFLGKGVLRTLRHGCSPVNLLHIFRAAFSKNTSGLLLLSVITSLKTYERIEIKASGRPAILIKKRLWHRCFPLNFAKFLRTSFLQNTSWRLLVQIRSKTVLKIITQMTNFCSVKDNNKSIFRK